jgi:hypothetical protein
LYDVLGMIRFLPLLIALSLVPAVSAKSKLDVDLYSHSEPQISSAFRVYGVKEIKNAFRKGLQEYLIAQKDVRVRFYPTRHQDIVRGKFELMEIVFRDSSIQGLENLNIRRGRLKVSNLKFDVDKLMSEGKLKVTTVGQVKFSLRLDEEDINTYLTANQKRINLGGPKIELTEDRMLFSGRIKNRFFSARVKTEGRFVVNQAKRTVDFRTNSVRLNAFKIPGFVTGSIVNRINPVLNLNRFPLMELIPVKLQNIELGDGFVEFKGA